MRDASLTVKLGVRWPQSGRRGQNSHADWLKAHWHTNAQYVLDKVTITNTEHGNICFIEML